MGFQYIFAYFMVVLVMMNVTVCAETTADNGVQIQTPYDFDGDGRADITVFRPSTGTWYSINSLNNSYTFTNWGLSTDIRVPGDFNADGKTDFTAYRNGYVYLSVNGSLQSYLYQLDSPTIMTAADISGDGRADVANFNNGLWQFCTNPNGCGSLLPTIIFGETGDKPYLADFDGDRKADFTVYHPANGRWSILKSTDQNVITTNFGISTDLPVPADYDGDGKADIAVFRPSVGDWYWLNSSDGSFTGVHWGANGDKPVPADYDGDGKADIGVFRPSDGTWYILQSTAGFKAVNWGLSTDIPIPNVYVR